MRSILLYLAVIGFVSVGFSFPNSKRGRPIQDIDLKRMLEILEEVRELDKTEKNERQSWQDYVREEADTDDDREPYIEKKDEYLWLARRVADQYMNEERSYQEDYTGSDTTNDALRAFNRPSKRTRMIAEENERKHAERLVLRLLIDPSDDLRSLGDIDLTALSAAHDPTCKRVVDCSKKINSNFVDGKEFRTIDGSCNNRKHFSWGFAGAQHRRLLPNAYEDNERKVRSKSVQRGKLPSARKVSNAVHSTPTPKGDNTHKISIALFYFMQFIDHDLAKTPEGHVRRNKKCCNKPDSNRKYCLPVTFDEPDEEFFRRDYCVEGRRSFTVFDCDNNRVENQINELTSYLDASMVYGSSTEEEHTLRTFIGGLLEQSTNELLPNSSRGSQLPCNTTTNEHRKDSCFEAGDTRANVHPGLLTYHTLFVREHNRIAREFQAIRKWSDERIFQETRKIISAFIQHIVYEEMLPVLFNEDVLKEHRVNTEYKYDDTIDASMTQAFAMCYRYHNLMPHKLNLGREVGNTAQVFRRENQEFAIRTPIHVTNNNYNGINEVTLGMVVSRCPHVDRLMNSATRNLLFLDKDGNSSDLATLNILRGREWGTPAYSEFRKFCGLGDAKSWYDLKNTTSVDNIEKMKSVYKDVRDVDLWTGMIAETPLPDSISGATQSCLLAKHFSNIKHGDRFWYENEAHGFDKQQLLEIKKVTLARILCSNLDVTLMRENVFRTNTKWKTCADIIGSGDTDFKNWPK